MAFSGHAPHRLYHWELFVHAPLRIAERLREEGDFAGALRWLHFVFDPAEATQPFSSNTTMDFNEAWRPRPLYQPTAYTTVRDRPM